MVLGSKSAHWKSGTEEGKQIGTLEVWNRGGKGGKKELLTRTIKGRRSHLLWSSPDPSPVLAFARRQKEVAGRGSSPEGADQRREEGSSLAAPAGRGGGGNGGSGSLTLVAAMEGAQLGRDWGVSESGRGADQRREEGSSLAAPAGRGGGGNGGSGGLTLVAAMEGARLGRDSGVSESGRGRNVWRWPLGASLEF